MVVYTCGFKRWNEKIFAVQCCVEYYIDYKSIVSLLKNIDGFIKWILDSGPFNLFFACILFQFTFYERCFFKIGRQWWQNSRSFYLICFHFYIFLFFSILQHFNHTFTFARCRWGERKIILCVCETKLSISLYRSDWQRLR